MKLTILFATVICAAAQAQPLSFNAALHMSDKPYIQATGEATVSVKPDRAVIDIGVVTEETTAAGAALKNATQTETVLANFRGLVNTRGHVTTATYSVRPNYRVPKPGAAQVLVGYGVTNTVEVTLDDLSLLSKVIDAATQAGANSIQGLRFELKDSSVVHARALRLAAEQAKANADAMAAGVGLKLGRIVSIEEPTTEEPFAYHKRAAAPMQAGLQAPTPIEIGTLDFTATVILRAEIQ